MKVGLRGGTYETPDDLLFKCWACKKGTPWVEIRRNPLWRSSQLGVPVKDKAAKREFMMN